MRPLPPVLRQSESSARENAPVALRAVPSGTRQDTPGTLPGASLCPVSRARGDKKV